MFKILTIVTLLITMSSFTKAELIVLASPIDNGDGYYTDMEDDIFNFHVQYAKIISKHDDVIILTDSTRYHDYVAELGADKVAIAPMQDIWMRDFTLSNTTNPIMFRYTAAAQGVGQKGQDDADYVQEAFAKIIDDAELVFKESDLLNDGGNFVDDYTGNVVVSTKFLADNNFSEDEARKLLTQIPGIKNIAFIEADEQG